MKKLLITTAVLESATGPHPLAIAAHADAGRAFLTRYTEVTGCGDV